MPLTIMRRRGRSCPTVLCDVCGDEIQRASEGLYIWRQDLDSPQPVGFTHKRCRRVFAARTPAARWNSVGLEVLPAYLRRTLGVTRQRSEELATVMGLLG